MSEYGGISATVSQDTQDYRSSENTGTYEYILRYLNILTKSTLSV